MERSVAGMSGLVFALVAPSVFAQAPAAPAKPAVAPAAAAGKPAPAPGAAPATADGVPAGPAKAPAGMTPPAAPMTPPPAPKPAAELDSFKVFVGKWKCSGKMFAGPFGPEHPFTASAEVAFVSDNFWQTFKYEEKKSKEHRGLKVLGIWGYDAGAKRFVRAGGGNEGTWDTASATGWEGDKLTWTGEFSGPLGRMPFHQTFTKTGDKTFTYAVEVRTPDGKWAPYDEVSCKK
jgi:hypothetical protein